MLILNYFGRMKRYINSQILRSAKWGVQKGGKMNIINMLLGNQLLVETVVIGACTLVFTCVVLNAIRKGHGFRNFLNSLIIAIAVSAVRYCVSTVSPVAGAVVYAAMILLYLYYYVLFFNTDRFWQAVLLMVILLLLVPPTTAAGWKASLLWENRTLTTWVTALPLWLSLLSILVFLFVGIAKAIARKKAAPAAVEPAAQSAQTAQTAQAAQSTQSGQPAQSAQSGQQTQRTAQPGQSAQSAQAGQQTQRTAQSARSGQQTQRTAQSSQSARSATQMVQQAALLMQQAALLMQQTAESDSNE